MLLKMKHKSVLILKTFNKKRECIYTNLYSPGLINWQSVGPESRWSRDPVVPGSLYEITGSRDQ